MKFENKLSVNDYLETVETIANGFFNDNGEYVPHIGRIVAVTVYCDMCMKESVFSDVENPDMDVIFSNEEIMDAYSSALDEALTVEYDQECLTFGNAYYDALKIVDYRKSSMVQAVGLITGLINEVMSPDNLSKLYEASDRLKEVVNSTPDNVVPMFPKKES